MPVAEAKTLEQKQFDKRNAKTVWQSDKKDWEYVTVPAQNALGETHSPIVINEHEFGPKITRNENGEVIKIEDGKYLVPPEAAITIRERCQVYAKECVRILQPKRDFKSEQLVSRFGAARAQGVSTEAVAE